MGKLIALGAAIIGFHGAHHQPRYWWPAHVDCTISTSTYRNGTWRAQPYIQCVGHPDQFKTTPPPYTMAGLSGCQVDNWGDPAGIAACAAAEGLPTAP